MLGKSRSRGPVPSSCRQRPPRSAGRSESRATRRSFRKTGSRNRPAKCARLNNPARNKAQQNVPLNLPNGPSHKVLVCGRLRQIAEALRRIRKRADESADAGESAIQDSPQPSEFRQGDLVLRSFREGGSRGNPGRAPAFAEALSSDPRDLKPEWFARGGPRSISRPVFATSVAMAVEAMTATTGNRPGVSGV